MLALHKSHTTLLSRINSQNSATHPTRSGPFYDWEIQCSDIVESAQLLHNLLWIRREMQKRGPVIVMQWDSSIKSIWIWTERLSTSRKQRTRGKHKTFFFVSTAECHWLLLWKARSINHVKDAVRLQSILLALFGKHNYDTWLHFL